MRSHIEWVPDDLAKTIDDRIAIALARVFADGGDFWDARLQFLLRWKEIRHEKRPALG